MTGAGFSTHGTPAAVAASTAATTASPEISVLTSTQPALGSARCIAARTWSAVSAMLAPAPTAIWFSPAESTTMRATPVASPRRTATSETSMPSARSSSSARTPSSSAPTAPIRRTEPLARAAATAALAPLPPPCRETPPPTTVSPGPGRRGAATTRSMLTAPTTMTHLPPSGPSSRPAVTRDPPEGRRCCGSAGSRGARRCHSRRSCSRAGRAAASPLGVPCPRRAGGPS